MFARILVVFSVLSGITVAACKSDEASGGDDLAVVADAAEPVDLKHPDLAPRPPSPGPPDLAGVDLFGYPAPHEPLPVMAKHSGTVLKKLHLVSVSYDDYANRDSMEAMGDFIFGSKWWDAVTSEYGIIGGVHEGTIHLPGAAPTMATSGDLLDALELALDAGNAPLPTDNIVDQVLYVIYISPTTVLKETPNGTSCNDYYGFHGSRYRLGQTYAFAIVADCGKFEDVMATFGHELVEATTDPYSSPTDGYYVDVTLPSHWAADPYKENADLCEDEDYIYEGSFVMQPAWSNAAAAAGLAPCVPNNDWPYFGFDVSPKTAPTVAKGSTVVFTITGWAMSPTNSWGVAADATLYSRLTTAQMKPVLSDLHVNNGTSITLTLTVPANAVSGNVGAVEVYSTLYPSRMHPVAFIVQ